LFVLDAGHLFCEGHFRRTYERAAQLFVVTIRDTKIDLQELLEAPHQIHDRTSRAPKDRHTPILIWIVVAATILAICQHVFMALYPFPLSGHDAHVHLAWIEEFDRLRDFGILYPRWLPLSFGGFGATTFYFYPPLTYFLGDAIHSVLSRESVTGIFHLIELAGMVLSGLGMFAYLRHNLFSMRASLLGGAVVATALYRHLDITTRNALAEQLAFIWIPVLLLSIDYALSDREDHRIRSFVLATIGWAGIVLTNIPTAVLAIFTIPLYGILRSGFKLRPYVPHFLGALLAALMSAVYVLPVIELQPYFPKEHLFDFYLPGLRWGFALKEISAPGVHITAEHLLVPLTMLLAIASSAYFWSSRRSSSPSRNRLYAAMIGVTFLGVFLQMPFSLAIWDHFPPLQLLQFSWRWSGILLFVPAVGVALAIDRWGETSISNRLARWSVAIYSLFVMFWYARYIFIVVTFAAPPPMVDAARTGAAEHVPSTAYFTLDPWTSIHYATRRLDEAPVTPDRTGASVQLMSDSGITRAYSVDARSAFNARFHLYYWPYWKLRVNEIPVPTYADAHGIMNATLPSGHYIATLTLERSSGERVGTIISLVASALFAGVCVFGFLKARRR
jgi:hypothetical protein